MSQPVCECLQRQMRTPLCRNAIERSSDVAQDLRSAAAKQVANVRPHVAATHSSRGQASAASSTIRWCRCCLGLHAVVGVCRQLEAAHRAGVVLQGRNMPSFAQSPLAKVSKPPRYRSLQVHPASTFDGNDTTRQYPHLLKPWHDAVLVKAVIAWQLHHDGVCLALFMAHCAGVPRLACCMLPRLLPRLLPDLLLLLLLLSALLCITTVTFAGWLFGTADRWGCACCCCSLCRCRHLASPGC